jgi:hypothetical protein
MDLKGFVPADNDSKSLVEECERIARNNPAVKNDEVEDDDEQKKSQVCKTSKQQQQK